MKLSLIIVQLESEASINQLYIKVWCRKDKKETFLILIKEWNCTLLHEPDNNNLCLIFGSLISQQKDKIKWLQFPLPISLNWQVQIFQKYFKASRSVRSVVKEGTSISQVKNLFFSFWNVWLYYIKCWAPSEVRKNFQN